ncbi:MAG: hypothetical protein HYY29_02620 [Chloroflexi bacterium]|nr:hypothetical protein [Chloroflexota bacterium]
MHDTRRYSPALVAAIIYTGISVLASGVFVVVTLIGDYSWVARVGGAAWVFLLTMIVLMPVVIPAVKRWG